LDQYKEKMDLIQLMKDMLLIKDKGHGSNVLYEDDLDAKYKALGCKLEVRSYAVIVFPDRIWLT
jgi:hypothetical protein